MKKSVKILLIVLVVLAVAGGGLLGFLLGRGGSNIGREEALTIALEQAGLSKSDVHDIDIDLERRRGGNARYEVDFEYLGTDYDCFIDAVTGQVLAVSGPMAAAVQSGAAPVQTPALAPQTPANAPAPAEGQAPADAPAPAAGGASLTREEALAIALADVDLAESDVFDIDVELDRQKGVQVYEVDFETADMDFDYTIDAATGEITRMTSSGKRGLGQETASQPQSKTAQGDYIGQEAALAAALKHAGVQESEVYDVGIELDWRISSVYYEVDFETLSTEYEYDIDAITGGVLNSRSEPRD